MLIDCRVANADFLQYNKKNPQSVMVMAPTASAAHAMR